MACVLATMCRMELAKWRYADSKHCKTTVYTTTGSRQCKTTSFSSGHTIRHSENCLNAANRFFNGRIKCTENDGKDAQMTDHSSEDCYPRLQVWERSVIRLPEPGEATLLWKAAYRQNKERAKKRNLGPVLWAVEQTRSYKDRCVALARLSQDRAHAV